jgi:hypothetical protein
VSAETPNAQKLHYERRKAAGICTACKKPVSKGIYCEEHRIKNLQEQNSRWHALRAEVIAAYGGVCACCNETMFACLQIDHIDGKGAEQRRELKRPDNYLWLKRNGYPPGYQILCASCNFAKHRGAECPHQTQRRDMLKKLSAVPLTY